MNSIKNKKEKLKEIPIEEATALALSLKRYDEVMIASNVYNKKENFVIRELFSGESIMINKGTELHKILEPLIIENNVSLVEIPKTMLELKMVFNEGYKADIMYRGRYSDNIDNGEYIIVQKYKTDTMSLDTFLKRIDKLQLLPLKIHDGYIEFIKSLYNDRKIMDGIKSKAFKFDPTLDFDMKNVPNVLKVAVKNRYKNISDDCIHFFNSVLSILNNFGINQFSLCVVYQSYFIILTCNLEIIKGKIDKILARYEYFAYISKEIREQGIMKFIDDEQTKHGFKFLPNQKYIDLFRTIDMLLKVDKDIKIFDKELKTSPTNDYDKLIGSLSNNIVFASFMNKHVVDMIELKKILAYFNHCYYYINGSGWRQYYIGFLIQSGISFKSFTFDEILLSKDHGIVINYINEVHPSDFTFNTLKKLVQMLDSIQSDQNVAIYSENPVLSEKKFDCTHLFGYIMHSLTITTKNINELFTFIAYFEMSEPDEYNEQLKNDFVTISTYVIINFLNRNLTTDTLIKSMNVLHMACYKHKMHYINLFAYVMQNLVLTNQNIKELFNFMTYLKMFKDKLSRTFITITKNIIINYYNQKIQFRPEIEILNMFDFITCLWKAFPNDSYVSIFSHIDIDIPYPKNPNLNDYNRLRKQPINTITNSITIDNIIRIDRYGNKSMNIIINKNDIINSFFNAKNILIPFFDKRGYSVESLNEFLFSTKEYLRLMK
jgi:hypothetical protein